MGENEISYTSFQFANSRGFDFCFGGRRMGKSLFWRKEKGNNGGKRKGFAFCLLKVKISDLGSWFGLWHSIMKGKAESS